jgi:ABC-type oligopeptide transport system substrate-binding subunit
MTKAANAAGDPKKRMRLLQEAERYIMEEQMPALPLYYYRMIHLYDDAELDGVSLHPRNLQMFHRMRMNKKSEARNPKPE